MNCFQAGLHVDGRPRLTPLPAAGVAVAVHAVCPVGHLKSAFGGFQKDTAVALIEEVNASIKCFTMQGVELVVPRSLIKLTFPVLVKYNHSHTAKSLSFRYRACVMDNANAFQYEFCVDGFN